MPSTFPHWLKKTLPANDQVAGTWSLIRGLNVKTVCSSAMCPNLAECFSQKTATFMILGNRCTRGCRFCAVEKGQPLKPSSEEPKNVSEAVRALGLTYVVITSVTRDDLEDGGAFQFVLTIDAIRAKQPDTAVEVLTPDFKGKNNAIDTVASRFPEVYGHNLETVSRLYRKVRPGSGYTRSLRLLERVKRYQPGIFTKSGLMVGLGETAAEIRQAMKDLRSVGCDMITIGQYLQPSKGQLKPENFVFPECFEELHQTAMDMGFYSALCGSFVRSSYKASHLIKI